MVGSSNLLIIIIIICVKPYYPIVMLMMLWSDTVRLDECATKRGMKFNGVALVFFMCFKSGIYLICSHVFRESSNVSQNSFVGELMVISWNLSRLQFASPNVFD